MPVKIAALAAVLLAVCAALFIFTMRDGAAPGQPPMELTKAESPAAAKAGEPFFQPPREGDLPQAVFRSGDATETKMGDFKGKPVVINFWATWCAPCVKELPSLARLKATRPDLAVIALSLDRDGPNPAPFLKDVGADGLDPYSDPSNKLMRLFRLRGLPTTIVISADGKELGRREGEAEWDSASAQAEIDKILASAK